MHAYLSSYLTLSLWIKACVKKTVFGGRWEGGSCLGTHVRIKDFKIKKNKKILKKRQFLEKLEKQYPTIKGHLG